MKNQSFTTIATMTTGVPAGISQVGLIRYYNGQVAWKYSTDVDPDGEGEARVFADIVKDLYWHLHKQIAVCYGLAARESIEAAFEDDGLACPEVWWLDCRKVVQRI